MAEAQTKARTRKPTKAKQVEQTARSYFDAVGRRDLEAMAGFYDSEVVLDLVPVGVKRGPDEYRAFFEELFRAIPDLEFQVTRITANADVAAVEWRLSGTFSGASLQGIEATGRHVEVRGCDCLDIKDGKILKNTAYYDGMQLARGMGLLPAQDSGAERAMTQAFNAVTKLRRAVQERR